MFRESCIETDYAYIKDLARLGRDLSKTLIVDDTLHSFGYQLDNGILIKTYEGEANDNALLHLWTILMKIKDEPDLREALKNIKV